MSTTNGRSILVFTTGDFNNWIISHCMKLNSHNMSRTNKCRSLGQAYEFLSSCPAKIKRVLNSAQLLLGKQTKKQQQFFHFGYKSAGEATWWATRHGCRGTMLCSMEVRFVLKVVLQHRQQMVALLSIQQDLLLDEKKNLSAPQN